MSISLNVTIFVTSHALNVSHTIFLCTHHVSLSLKFKHSLKGNDSWAPTSVSAKYEKVFIFTYFCSKTTHINPSITLFKCKIATIYLHDYCNYVSYYFKLFSLLSLVLSNFLSHSLQCQEEEDNHQHPYTITTNHYQPPPTSTHHHHQPSTTITTNQTPPPQPTHYNINLMQTKSTKN